MPAGDGTGPMGMGPMTGRAAGFCAGYGRPGYMNPVPGRGCGMGFGRGRRFGMGFGRGWRNMYCATGLTGVQRSAADWSRTAPTPEQEKEGLKNQAENLENALREIHARLQEMEKVK